MKHILASAAFSGQAINEQQAKSLIAQGQQLLDEASATAGSLY